MLAFDAFNTETHKQQLNFVKVIDTICSCGWQSKTKKRTELQCRSNISSRCRCCCCFQQENVFFEEKEGGTTAERNSMRQRKLYFLSKLI